MTADVVVIGGGMSGQTLARQLLLREPGMRIAVIDGSELPRPDDTLRLGESTSEVAGWYFRDRLSLEDHLRSRHIVKAGLRFFFADVGGRGFGGRSEYGLLLPKPGFLTLPFNGTNPPTFQLHRGRIEHFLVTENVAMGATMVDRATVRDVTLGSPHRITVDRGGSQEILEAEWVIDATGPAGFLRPRIAEVVPGPHHARASFFWADAPLDCDEWSDRPEFLDRVPRDVRWHSTGHLLGDGYWIWLIRLGSGQTSVGVVADPLRHPAIVSPEKMMGWLDAHEPELGAASGRVGI
jgi:flavin-dependent dehydrogenase